MDCGEKVHLIKRDVRTKNENVLVAVIALGRVLLVALPNQC